MKYKSPFENLLSVKMTTQLMCFGNWNIELGETKPKYKKELNKFLNDFEFKTQKNSDIAKQLIQLIKENKVVVKRSLTKEEKETLFLNVESFFHNNPNPSDFELEKEGDFEWNLAFDWKTVLLPISEGKFDK
jgi:hypothetical protein